MCLAIPKSDLKVQCQLYISQSSSWLLDLDRKNKSKSIAIVFRTRRRRDIKIQSCLLIPVRKSLIQ